VSRVTVGAVTIGQSPRTDITPELCAVLGDDVHIVQAGCLDGLSIEEIGALAPRQRGGGEAASGRDRGGATLVTRLRDGREVELDEDRVVPLLQERVDQLAGAGVAVVAVLCTGRLAPMRCSRLLVETHSTVLGFVRAVAGGRRLGVVVPHADQIPDAEEQWGAIAGAVRVVAASPYRPGASLSPAATALAEWGVDAVLLDCLGFGATAKAEVARRARVPVLLPRTILARTVAELV
jgi:protein AroM